MNRPFTAATLGVSAITCPSPASGGFSVGQCTAQIIDTAGADRQWITSDGRRVWISYHDSGSSSLIHVQPSDDDGFTWKKVASPIVGQDGATANSTFNSIQGPLVADPFTHNVYPMCNSFRESADWTLKNADFADSKAKRSPFSAFTPALHQTQCGACVSVPQG